MSMQQADIAVVGDGITGNTIAYGLAEQGWQVAQLCTRQNDLPASALSVAIGIHGKQALDATGLWQQLWQEQNFARAFFRIQAFAADGQIICFDSRDIYHKQLGWIVQQHKLLNALKAAVAKSKVQRIHDKLENIQQGELLLADGKHIKAKLIIAADGAGSVARDLIGIKTTTHDYRQSALVCTVSNSTAPIGTARQWFHKDGPLALLPLPEQNRQCLIWSMPSELAEQAKNMDNQSFNALVNDITDAANCIKVLDQRKLYPLKKQHATTYSKDRMVLLGDSAHQAHPMAGIGANLGLMDASCLLQLLQQARIDQSDPGGIGMAYNRRRRAHNARMLNAIDLTQAIYGAQGELLCQMRTAGIKCINNLSPIKAMLMQHAIGKSGIGAHKWYTALC